MFGFFKRSPEEEEDHARFLLTRRKFFFLGAAAAGAAILKPHLPLFTQADILAPIDQTEGVFITPPPTMQELLVTYYDRRFIETLRARLSVERMAITKPIPRSSSKFYGFGR